MKYMAVMLFCGVFLFAQTDPPATEQQSGSSNQNQPTSEATNEPQVSVCDDSTGPEVKRVRVGQRVTAGLLINRVQPKYPKAARKAHIEGTVLLCAVIAKDGKITNLRVVSGPKEFTESTVKAVQKWVYRPYMLDGEAVDVITEIRVNFSLK